MCFTGKIQLMVRDYQVVIETIKERIFLFALKYVFNNKFFNKLFELSTIEVSIRIRLSDLL